MHSFSYVLPLLPQTGSPGLGHCLGHSHTARPCASTLQSWSLGQVGLEHAANGKRGLKNELKYRTLCTKGGSILIPNTITDVWVCPKYPNLRDFDAARSWSRDHLKGKSCENFSFYFWTFLFLRSGTLQVQALSGVLARESFLTYLFMRRWITIELCNSPSPLCVFDS